MKTIRLGISASLLAASAIAQSSGPLTDIRIIQLVQAGIRQDELIRLINTAPSVDFLLTPSATTQMMQAGVSEDVIKTMAARESGSAVASPSVRPINQSAISPVPAAVSPSPRPAINALSDSAARPILIPSAVRTTAGFKVEYDGGSIPNVKSGSGLKVYIDSQQIRITHENSDVAVLPAAAISEISYGQDVHRRVGAAIGLAVVSFGVGALMALTKSKKHFIGLTWDYAGARGGVAFQADKNDYRGLLAGLEGVTGRKAVNSDAMSVKN